MMPGGYRLYFAGSCLCWVSRAEVESLKMSFQLRKLSAFSYELL